MVEQTDDVGQIAELRRYPVKSMQGESVASAALTERGLVGDRAYAVVEAATGNVASAKNPRKWQQLWNSHAAYVEPPQAGKALPPVVITLSDRTTLRSDQPDIDQRLSAAFGREVVLTTLAPTTPQRETLAVDDDTPLERAAVRVDTFALGAPGTFFDFAPIHILTTSTLDHLSSLEPSARWDVRRFRPNIVIALDYPIDGFAENDWLGQHMLVGATVRLTLSDPAPRCVVTTLANADLPHDPTILRTAARHNAVASITFAPGHIFPAVVGVYAHTLADGTLRHGDRIVLQHPGEPA